MSQKPDIIPQLAVSGECSLVADAADSSQGVCASEELVNEIKQTFEVADESKPKEIVEKAKKISGCSTEKCVVESVVNRNASSAAKLELFTKYKISGPIDNTLLNNNNIDRVLKQWELSSMKKTHKMFAYNFNMRNYREQSFRKNRVLDTPDTLHTIKMEDLKNYDTACCVINTDYYYGKGKHWMALFVDMRGSTKTVEFFNSSANPPLPEYVDWLVKTKNELKSMQDGPVEIVNVIKIKHQDSRSECGLYSLFYIWLRYNGVPYQFFMENSVADHHMFEFRQYLFEDKVNTNLRSGGAFDWAAYAQKVKVEWEKRPPPVPSTTLVKWVKTKVAM